MKKKNYGTKTENNGDMEGFILFRVLKKSLSLTSMKWETNHTYIWLLKFSLKENRKTKNPEAGLAQGWRKSKWQFYGGLD